MQALADAPPKPPVVTISGDHGGRIFPYQLRVEQWRRSGTKVRISGECSSACTLALSLPMAQVCVSKEAMLGFHQGSNSVATAVMWRAYPAPIRTWLIAEYAQDFNRAVPSIPLTSTVHWLSGAALQRRASSCS